MSADILRFDDVLVRFNAETIYENLSFSVRPGEFLCILGPSGCGKSTSLRLMGDLLSADSGSVTVTGLPPEQGWDKLAYVFQSPRLVPWRNAINNVILGMELRFAGKPKSEMKEKATELLRLVGLQDDMEKYPSMLSGGERQRVAIARALSVEPEIILMDEPFSALDLNTRHRMRAEIIRIWQETGKTVIFVTHDIDEALVLADRILLLSNKPTHVLETITLDEPRPREIGASASLRQQKDHLIDLFRTLETGYELEDVAMLLDVVAIRRTSGSDRPEERSFRCRTSTPWLGAGSWSTASISSVVSWHSSMSRCSSSAPSALPSRTISRREERRLFRWMARAASDLPAPGAPSISTVVSHSAARATALCRRRITGVLPPSSL